MRDDETQFGRAAITFFSIGLWGGMGLVVGIDLGHHALDAPVLTIGVLLGIFGLEKLLCYWRQRLEDSR